MTESEHEFAVTEPYRLDLTVTALRRVATNVVDVYSADGEYHRAFDDQGQISVVRVRQPSPDRLLVGVGSDAPDHEAVLATLRSMLGWERRATAFAEILRSAPWLADLVVRFRGLRPPRYPSLWETFVNTVVFQQVSLQSASAITRRLVMALGEAVQVGDRRLYAFPTEDRFHRAPDAPLRAAGLSASKLRTLRGLAEGLREGEISAERLEKLSSADAARELQTLSGIGPWTAAVILLRGLGRLDVFPPNDSGVAANLRRFSHAPLDLRRLLEEPGTQRGLLYFLLLLARLDDQGLIGEPSVPSP